MDAVVNGCGRVEDDGRPLHLKVWQPPFRKPGRVVRPQRVSCHDGLVRMIGQRHRIDDCPRRCIHMDDSRGRPLDEDPEAACAIGLRVGSGAANVDVAQVCRVAGPDVGEGLQEGRRHPDLRAGNGDATGRDG